jgi:hypothetical protein
MKRSTKIAVGVAGVLTVTIATVFAQTTGMGQGMMRGMGQSMGQGTMGHGTTGQGKSAGHDHAAGGHAASHASSGSHGHMGGPTAMLTSQDAGSAADMDLVHDLLANNEKIKRTVTNLPDGIRTVTESDDPKVAQAIKAHVASMSARLKDGREFNIFSTTLPVLFENKDNIKSTVQFTDKGAVVVRTSTDAKVVAALKGHAGEVTELVNEGMVAMQRGMMSRMAAGPRGPQAGMRPGQGHTH